MKAIVIIGDILVMMWVFSISMNETGIHGMMYFNEMLIIVGICLLNIYYLSRSSKKEWSDKFLNHRLLKKRKTLKIILVPVVIFFIVVSILNDSTQDIYKQFLYKLKNPKQHFADWTGIQYINQEPFCKIEEGFNTKEECINWADKELENNQDDSFYHCGKDCYYDKNCHGKCRTLGYRTSLIQSEIKIAQNTLITFFDLLSENKFQEASWLFSPNDTDWEPMKIYSPGTETDRAKILENYCEATQTCLKTEILDSRIAEEGKYIMNLRFINPDGSIYVFGPCCGATEEEMPSKREFEYEVKKIGNEFKVITTPLYRP